MPGVCFKTREMPVFLFRAGGFKRKNRKRIHAFRKAEHSVYGMFSSHRGFLTQIPFAHKRPYSASKIRHFLYFQTSPNGRAYCGGFLTCCFQCLLLWRFSPLVCPGAEGRIHVPRAYRHIAFHPTSLALPDAAKGPLCSFGGRRLLPSWKV